MSKMTTTPATAARVGTTPDIPPVREALERISSMLEDANTLHSDNPRSWAIIDMAHDLVLEALAGEPQKLDATETLNAIALMDGARNASDISHSARPILGAAIELADVVATLLMDWGGGERVRAENLEKLAQAMRIGAPVAATAPVDNYLADPRLDLCLSAAQEIEHLLAHIQRCIDDESTPGLHRKTHAIMKRARSLTGAIQDGIGDDIVPTSDVAAIVNLEAA